MATRNAKDANTDIPSGKGMKMGIVVSRWNHDVTGRLLEGCVETLKKHEVQDDDITIEYVPGAFELPLGARLMSSADKYDAIICIGCVIKGETKHDEYISNSVANGIMHLGLMSSIPVIFGVLTPNDQQQAEDRAGGKLGNKGDEAATSALQMAHLRKNKTSSAHKIGFA